MEHGARANAERAGGMLADHEGAQNLQHAIAQPGRGAHLPRQKAEIFAVPGAFRRCRAPIPTILRTTSERRRLYRRVHDFPEGHWHNREFRRRGRYLSRQEPTHRVSWKSCASERQKKHSLELAGRLLRGKTLCHEAIRICPVTQPCVSYCETCGS